MGGATLGMGGGAAGLMSMSHDGNMNSPSMALLPTHTPPEIPKRVKLRATLSGCTCFDTNMWIYLYTL